MKKSLTALFLLLILTIASAPAQAADPCLACHERKTPGIVNYWKESIHFRKNVSCADCHGRDVEENHNRKRMVTAEVCGSCHAAALASHKLSKHAISLKAGQGCTRNLPAGAERDKSCSFCHKEGTAAPIVTTECAMFLAQSPEMQRQGCSSCHRVEISCDSCHTKHGTDRATARNPGVCGVCHMGPDHPQMEMWETSQHGVLYQQSNGKAGPSCVTCHMEGGSHNVSRGIATGLSPTSALRKQERDGMIALCGQCHTREFATRNLADAIARCRAARPDGIVERIERRPTTDLPAPQSVGATERR